MDVVLFLTDSADITSHFNAVARATNSIARALHQHVLIVIRDASLIQPGHSLLLLEQGCRTTEERKDANFETWLVCPSTDKHPAKFTSLVLHHLQAPIFVDRLFHAFNLAEFPPIHSFVELSSWSPRCVEQPWKVWLLSLCRLRLCPLAGCSFVACDILVAFDLNHGRRSPGYNERLL